jgi:hypothetical protein
MAPRKCWTTYSGIPRASSELQYSLDGDVLTYDGPAERDGELRGYLLVVHFACRAGWEDSVLHGPTTPQTIERATFIVAIGKIDVATFQTNNSL